MRTPIRMLMAGAGMAVLLAGAAVGQTRGTERAHPAGGSIRNAERGQGSSDSTMRRGERRDSRDENRGGRTETDRRPERGEDRRFDRDGGHDGESSLRRGSAVTRLPGRHETVEIGGRKYFSDGDHYFVPDGDERSGRYVVVDPPTGGRVSRLPVRHERRNYGGAEYFVADDVYYRPEIHGGRTRYVVVDPPIGARISRLPDHHRYVVVGGERLCQVGSIYFRPIYIGGMVFYVRIELPVRQDTCVTGVVGYRERILLRDAVVVVDLLELTRFGTVRRSVGQQVIHRPRGFPCPFEICVDPREIDPTREYVIDAQILSAGRPRYISTQRTRVLERGGTSGIEINLRLSN